MQDTVVLGFDMETDVGSWTPFYEGLIHGTPRVLDTLGKHGAKATFFFTGESAQAGPEIVPMVDRAGHEVGCHSLQHETLGDEIFPIPLVKPVLPEECRHRIEVATDIVNKALGRPVTSFRVPRLFSSTAVTNALEDLGYVADASLPMYYHTQRVTPYHPSRDNWTEEGDMRILEIPNFADLTIESHDEFGRDRDQWPLLRTESAEALMVHVDNMLGFYHERNLPAVLCFYMHPWEFHDMPQGEIHYGEGSVTPDHFIVKNCGDYAVRQLDKLTQMLIARGCRFATATQLAEEYRNGDAG